MLVGDCRHAGIKCIEGSSTRHSLGIVYLLYLNNSFIFGRGFSCQNVQIAKAICSGKSVKGRNGVPIFGCDSDLDHIPSAN